MYYAGIDVSKYKHDCFIQTDFGDVINAGFSFANTACGFGVLQAELEKYGRGNIRIGLEATGNYGINLKLFLESAGFDFMEINPLLIKEHIKSMTLRKTKTDRLDARAIADYVASKANRSADGYRSHPTGFYPKFALKQLTRLRNCLQNHLNQTKHPANTTTAIKVTASFS